MLERLNNFSYWKEISIIFLIKIVALTTLWYFCFSPAHKQRVNPEQVAERLFFNAQGEGLINVRKY